MDEQNGNNSSGNSAKADLSAFSPRERILAAALKLFIGQGYFNTNIPDLSRESKCSVGSIYHNFKSKEEVAVALYNEGLNSFRSALYNSIQGKEDVEDIIKTIVKSFLTYSEINHHLSKYMWLCRHNEFMGGSIKLPTSIGYDPLGRKLTKAIKGGIRDGVIRDLRANVIWSILFGIPLSFVRDWLDSRSKYTPRSTANEIAEACWRALSAK